MYKAISLFSGAGGMDVGFKKAGFDVIWANDNDANACATYSANHENPIRCGSIETFFPELETLKGIDVVFGGPPCQGFSVAGKMDPADARSKLIWRYLDVVDMIRPSLFVMENVKALGTLSKWADVRGTFLRRVSSLGYSCEFVVLNSADFDTPQARERVFFIGTKGMILPPLHGILEKFKRKGPTVKETLVRLPRAGNPGNNRLCKAEITIASNPILRRSPYAGMIFNGLGRPTRVNGYAATLPASMGGNKTPIIDEEELYENKSSWVEKYHSSLMKGNKPLGFKEAPKRLRRLTLDECILLQTFPADYKFAGPNSSIFRQVGNAVPCNLAHGVASAAKFILDLRSRNVDLLAAYSESDQMKMFA